MSFDGTNQGYSNNQTQNMSMIPPLNEDYQQGNRIQQNMVKPSPTNQLQNTAQGPLQMSNQDMQQFGFSPQDFQIQMSNTQQNIMPQLDYLYDLPPEINPKIQQYADPYHQYQYQCYQQFAAIIPNATYEGSYNNNYEFEGKGKLTWPDGSFYDGMWKKNVRHGIGEYNTAGMVYKGQYFNDLKHGQGYMRTENGDQIYGSWSYDKRNGMAKLYKKGNEEPLNVIYKDDMMIKDPADTSMDRQEIIYTILSVVFLLAVAVIIPANIICVDIKSSDSSSQKYVCAEFKSTGIYVAVISWIIYQILSCVNKSTQYIRNVESVAKIFEDIQLAQKSPPQITFHMNCYKRKRKSRVLTHSASQVFIINKWTDNSPPASVLHYIKILLLARLNIHLIFNKSNEVQKRYDQEKNEFIRINSKSDENEFKETQTVEGHEEFTLVYNSENGDKPLYANNCLLTFLDLLIIGWIQRIYFVKKVFEIDFQTIKNIEE